MGLGIGLGGFATGFGRGYDIGTTMKADIKKNRSEKEQTKIDQAGQADFDARVAAGTDTPDNWQNFFEQYVIPRKTAAFISHGDLESADKWQTWADTDAAKRGGKLFADGVTLAQSGDTAAAMKKFVEAGQVRGYGTDTTIKEVTEVPGADGKPSTWRVVITGPSGKDTVKELNSEAEVLQFGATYINPEAAFTNSQKVAAEDAKRRADIEGKVEVYNRTQDAKRRSDIEAKVEVYNRTHPFGGKPVTISEYLALREQFIKDWQHDPDNDINATPSENVIKRGVNHLLRASGRNRNAGAGGAKGAAPGVSGGPDTLDTPAPATSGGRGKKGKGAWTFDPKTGTVTPPAKAGAAPPVSSTGPKPGNEAGLQTGAPAGKGDALVEGTGGRTATPAAPLPGAPAVVGITGKGDALEASPAAAGAPDAAAVPNPRPRPDVPGINGAPVGDLSGSDGNDQLADPAAPAGPGPAAPAGPDPTTQIRQLAAQAAGMKPGSPEYNAVINQIRQLKNQGGQ